MSRVTLLRAAARTATPWKNGGGQSTEVAIVPPGAGLDDFEWRISLALVAQVGRFSHFADVDRVLAVIEGDLRLGFDGEPEAIRLFAASLPFSFPGDVGVLGTPVCGKVVDLNLMTRRGRWTGSVERVSSSVGAVDLNCAQAVILFMGQANLHLSQETMSLRSLDAISFEAPDGTCVVFNTDQDVYVLRLAAVLP